MRRKIEGHITTSFTGQRLSVVVTHCVTELCEGEKLPPAKTSALFSACDFVDRYHVAPYGIAIACSQIYHSAYINAALAQTCNFRTEKFRNRIHAEDESGRNGSQRSDRAARTDKRQTLVRFIRDSVHRCACFASWKGADHSEIAPVEKAIFARFFHRFKR